jgi:class 3 adenylate cyclase/tetratricopeptide (TPR) repeat protein
LIRDLDPEAAQHLLDPALQHMMDAVHRFEGTVNQVLGDGIMALFGAPVAHEDHAVRACYAALAMQAALRRYAEEVRRSHGLEMQARVGLNSGEVVVRAIGNDLHMDYSAVGQTTHLAARMEQLAMPGSILLTAETLRLAAEVVQTKPLGLTPIRGLVQPLEVFELVGARPPRTRLQAFAARSLTRFVGRQAEFEVMRQAHALAGAGHGQLVAVMGEPGVGKTRLFYEWLCAPWTQGWLLFESQADSYGKAIPYYPVRALLKVYFQLEARDDARRMTEKVTGKLRALDPSLVPLLPAVLALLDVPVDDRAWQALEPPQRRQWTFDVLKRLLLGESQIQPVLLVCENLHWIDSETQAFLDSLIDSLPTARFLLLVNYRPEYQHPWGRKTYYTQIRIDPLPSTSAEGLLQALLGDDSTLAPLQRALIERTEGNPFFLEESVRTLVESQVLVGEPGAYRLARMPWTMQVPATVQAVLAARIDRLSPEEKQLLQTAAVIGTEIPLPLLQAIVDLPEAGLHGGLAHLQAAEFLYETRLFPEPAYTFKHALTHEVAYRSLLRERRRTLHAQIVEVIEAQSGHRLTDQVERLADHAFRGEVWDKAFAYSRQAGTRAIARSAHREAVACFEQALEALQHLPESRSTHEQAIDLRLALRSSLVPLGDLERIIQYLREAETLAIALHDSRRLGLIACFMINYFWVKGEPDQAIAAGQRALSLVPSVHDFALQINTQQFLGQVYCTRGDYRQAITLLEKNVTSLTGDLLQERFGQVTIPSVMARTYLTLCLAELGTFTDGVRLGTEAIHIAEAVNHPYSLTFAYFGVGLLYLRKGELSTAIPILERGLQLCQTWNLPIRFPSIASTLGYAYALSGRIPGAIPLLERAVEQTASLGRTDDHSLWVTWLSEAYLLAGRIEEGVRRAEYALELSRRHNEWGHQAYALCLLGEIATHYRLHSQQAEDSYKQALTLAEELSIRPLQAHCHRGLGMLYATRGQQEQARAELAAAIDLYRAMDMTFWLPQTKAALAQVEG